MDVENKNALEELLDEIQMAIKDAVSLKITTIVGDVKQDSLDGSPTVTNSKTMFSQINLIQGDIISMIDKSFLEEFANIREHHQAREDQAHEIISKNLKALKELGDFIRELIDNNQV